MRFRLVERVLLSETRHGYYEIDGEEYFDFGTGEVSGDDIFDTTKTDTPHYDELLSKPDYVRDKRNLKSEMVMMSPKEYFEECAKIFNSTFDNQVAGTAADKVIIDHLTKVITVAKRKFPLTYLNYAENTQEGRHRMYVAAMLTSWNTKFPVMVINWADEERHRDEVRRERIASIEHSLGSVAYEVLSYHYANYDELETQIQYEMDQEFGEGVNYDFKIGDNEFTITYDGVSKSFPTDWIKWAEPKEDDWEDDEDLYLMSDEELEDALRNELKESIEKGDDPVDLLWKMSTKDITSGLGIDTQDSIDDSSPMFVLPNGKIISVSKALADANLDFSNGSVVHADFVDVVLDSIMHQQGVDVATRENYIHEHRFDIYLDYFTTELGWTRLNCGNSWIDNRFYCVLPPSITRLQLYTLEEWIDWGQNKKQDVEIFVVKGKDNVDYHSYQLFHRNNFASLPTEDIIKNIKRYYSSGVFYESVNESELHKDKLNEVMLSKTTPYMLRSDGELLTCGTYHPYLKCFYEDSLEDSLEFTLCDSPRDFVWFYDNTRNAELKKCIEAIIKNAQDVDSLSDADFDGELSVIPYDNAPEMSYEELLQTFSRANDLSNEEFCRVRTSGLVDGGTGNGIYFRISSKRTNWFDLIWELVYKNRRWITDVTVIADPQATGEEDNYYRHNGTVFNKTPTEEFIMMSGSPALV